MPPEIPSADMASSALLAISRGEGWVAAIVIRRGHCASEGPLAVLPNAGARWRLELVSLPKNED
jgi:hypothetical protein